MRTRSGDYGWCVVAMSFSIFARFPWLCWTDSRNSLFVARTNSASRSSTPRRYRALRCSSSSLKMQCLTLSREIWSITYPLCVLVRDYTIRSIMCPLCVLVRDCTIRSIRCPLCVLVRHYTIRSIMCPLCVLVRDYTITSITCPLCVLVCDCTLFLKKSAMSVATELQNSYYLWAFLQQNCVSGCCWYLCVLQLKDTPTPHTTGTRKSMMTPSSSPRWLTPCWTRGSLSPGAHWSSISQTRWDDKITVNYQILHSFFRIPFLWSFAQPLDNNRASNNVCDPIRLKTAANTTAKPATSSVPWHQKVYPSLLHTLPSSIWKGPMKKGTSSGAKPSIVTPRNISPVSRMGDAIESW